jgi:hypothetical protein
MFLARHAGRKPRRGRGPGFLSSLKSGLSSLTSGVSSAFGRAKSFLGSLARDVKRRVSRARSPAGYSIPGMRPWTADFWKPLGFKALFDPFPDDYPLLGDDDEPSFVRFGTPWGSTNPPEEESSTNPPEEESSTG